MISEISELAREISALTQSIDRSATAVGGILANDVGLSVFVALVGALSAYLFNYIHWRHVSGRERISGVARTLGKLVEDVEITAVKYWLADCCEDNAYEMQQWEVMLKSRLRQLNKLTNALINESGHHSKFTDTIRDIESFVSNAFDLVTGGDFESLSRRKSRLKANQISTCCSQGRALLSCLELLR